MEEELHKVKAARSVDDLQRKELEDQLEAEQYFTTLYKTQVRELTDEVDEAKERQLELEREKEAYSNQLSGLAARAENESRAKRVAEEDMAELEKEKMMIELELEEINSKHKSQLRNLEMQLTASRDTESDLRHEYDMVTKGISNAYEKVLLLRNYQQSCNFTKFLLGKYYELIKLEKINLSVLSYYRRKNFL